MAKDPATIYTGKQLYEVHGIPWPYLRQLLISLSKEALIISTRGMCGGFILVKSKTDITLATLWTARPLKLTNELKFLLGGLLGFALAVPAGIMQADVRLNKILHNMQWVVGPHVHVAVLVGLTMTFYAAIYILFPILTNGAKLYSQKLANIHFWSQLIGGIGMGAFMGMAGPKGMLRRTLYFEGEFDLYMLLAHICGALLLIGFLAFFINIVMSVGLNGLAGLLKATKNRNKDLFPEAKGA